MRTSALRIPKPRLPVGHRKEWHQQELFETEPRPEALCYRGQTLAIMRHFFEISSQLGRLPSLLGREFFRAKVSHHAIPSFEEQAVFVRDIELCLARLSDEHAEIIMLVGLYNFTREEIGAMLHYSKTWVSQRVAQALDSLSEIFLQARILREDYPDRQQWQVRGRSLSADVAPICGKKNPAPSAEANPSERGVAAVS